MTNIEIAITVVERRIEWIRIAQAEGVIRLREGGAQIVGCVRERIVCYQAQTCTMQVRRLELNVHRMVVGVTARSAVIDVRILRMEAVSRKIAASVRVKNRIAQRCITAAEPVDVLD